MTEKEIICYFTREFIIYYVFMWQLIVHRVWWSQLWLWWNAG